VESIDDDNTPWDSQVDSQMIDGIHAPNLRELSFVHCTLRQFTNFASLIKVKNPPKVTILSWGGSVSREDDDYSPKPLSWRGLSATSFLGQVTHFRTELPNYREESEHPLTCCPEITHLEVIAWRNLSDLQWLVVAKEHGKHSYAGQEQTLPQLTQVIVDADVVVLETDKQRWEAAINESRRHRKLPLIELQINNLP
jgi:hypothetical protein